MEKTLSKSKLIVITALFVMQLSGVLVNGQGTDIKKPGENCDKMVMKTGQTLFVDITGIDSSRIYYLKCDSLAPQYSVLKRKVKSVKYENDDVVYSNDETYGKINTNSFGWRNYAEIFKAGAKKKSTNNKEVVTKGIVSQRDITTPRSTLKKLYRDYPEAMKEFNLSKTFDLAGLAVIGGGCVYLILSDKGVTKQYNNAYTTWWNNKPSNDSAAMFDDHKYKVKQHVNTLIGLGIATVGGVLLYMGANHYINSITIYNAKRSAGLIPVQLNLMMSSTEVGLRMRF